MIWILLALAPILLVALGAIAAHVVASRTRGPWGPR